ncbi:beta strand repeat-containing protein [Cellulomonas sp. 179-A 4D5 NHS]|uniref:beta strand repeat-containing protein n=1 Tax=Cellulomonas sp. 179-A 4D5 NHS TaxID=3142378 RepID=UPI0039A1B3EC
MFVRLRAALTGTSPAPQRRLVRRSRVAVVVMSLVLAPLTVLGGASPAQAAPIRDFTPVFSANTNGEILVAANTLMTCSTTSGSTGAGTCAAARGATSGNYSNNDYTMQYVDVDANAATVNSSSATLTLPAGGGVLFAALVWGGRTRGTATVGNNPVLRGQAVLTVPGGTPTTVTARTADVAVAPSDGWGTAYQSWLDVTDVVAAAGSGTYTLGNVQSAARVDNNYAGWSLVVAVADPSAPARNLTVFTGLASVANGDPLPTFTVSGFLTPPSGPVRTTVGAVSYEGDMGLTGDTFTLNSTPISNALNPSNNVFNSSISDRGAQVTTRAPAYANQLGFDADLFSANGVLPNSATSARISLTTSSEQYFPGVVTFSTELYDPKLLGTKTVVDDDGGQVLLGDTLTYTVPVENIGLDTASVSRFFDAIPTGTSYVPGSITVDGVPLTDAAGDDLAQYVPAGALGQGHVLAYLGAGATPALGGSIPMSTGTAQHLVTFRVRVGADATNGQRLVNAAALTYRGHTTDASSSSATNAVLSPVVTDPVAGNAPPTASSHIVSLTPAPGARTLDVDVLAGDSDPDGDALRVVGVTDAAGGELTVAPDGTVTYAPRDDFAGRDVFTYTIQDTAGNRATAVVQVEVVNTAPDAVDDAPSVLASTTTAVAVLANDTDANGDTLAVRSVSPTSTRGGTVALVDGEVRYTPPAGFRGTDSFTYVVEDPRGGSDTATVHLTVTNNAPVANDDTYTVAAGASVALAVGTNDTDAEGDVLTVALVTAPSHGTVTLNAGGTGTYAPAAGYTGPDSFQYRVTDSQGATSAPATVQITVNGAPVAVDDTATTTTGTAVDVDVLDGDTDPNADALTVTTVTPPDHGTAVRLPDGRVRYTPATGWAGTDTFEYTVSDGTLTDTATVTVTVANAAPVAHPDAVGTTTGTPATGIAVLANDTDPNIPGTTQTLTVTGATANNGATVVVNGGSTLTVTPAARFAGTVVVSYTVSDGAGGTATGTLTVTVDNALPTAVPDGPVDTPTNTSVLVDVLANDTDANGDTLTLVPGSLTTPVDAGGTTRGTVQVEDGQVRYTPPAGFSGTVTFGYTVTDPSGATSVSTVTVSVANAAPVAVDDVAPAATGTVVDIDVLANDTDANGTALTITAVTPPAHGVVELVDGRVRYTPAPGYAGTDTFTYTAGDGSLTDTATVTVTVANAAPVADDETATTPTGTPVTVDVLTGDTDPNIPGTTQTLTVTGVTANNGATATVDGGTVTVTPAPGFAGTVTAVYTVSDGAGGTDTGTLTVTVENAAPVAVDDTATTRSGTPAAGVAVLANDTDANIPGTGQTLTVTGAVADHGATVAVNSRDNTVTVTPAPGFAGTVTVTYTVSDGAGGTDTGTLTVAVDNAAPVAVDDSATTPYGTAVEVRPVANDTDADGDTLVLVPGSVSAPVDAGGATRGSVTVVGDVLTYTPPAGFSGEVTFTYEVTDGTARQSATVTVTVSPAAPTATPDSGAVRGDADVRIDVLGNDTDPDGGTLTLVSVTQPVHGSVAIVGDEVVYTPEPGYTGTVSFTYTLSDGQGGTSTATVTLDVEGTVPSAPAPVTPVAPVPTAPAPVTTPGGGTASGPLAATGAEAGLLATLASLLLAAGGVLVGLTRRRRGRHA